MRQCRRLDCCWVKISDKMKMRIFAVIAFCLSLCGCAESGLKQELKSVLGDAVVRYNAMAASIEQNNEAYPYSFEGGEMVLATEDKTWASGYFVGSMWMLAGWADDAEMQESAYVHTRRLDKVMDTRNPHDYAVVVNAAHRKGNEQKSNDYLVQSLFMVAKTMSNNFAAVYKAVENLEGDPEWYHRVSVCTLPVMEFICDTRWNAYAKIHADKTIENQFREDGAICEGYIYNRQNFEPIAPFSLHGANEKSAWAQGQAQALYAYTMLYRKCEESAYLDKAKSLAGYIISHLDESGIPNWDFDSEDKLKDSVAAAIMASAFVDLYSETKDEQYLQIAERQLATLCSAEYLASADECGGLLLKHGVGNRMTGEAVDAALVYGDYYLIEAITRYLEL